MGPTASGKTAVAVDLVRHFPFEIISVDSALVYRGMDIGTAKPDAAILSAAPHRLIDIRDPSEPYSAAEFREDALVAMAEITAAGRIPLLTGGTMLYFRALESGLSVLPAADLVVRASIEAEAAESGWAALHKKLSQVDPVSAARINANDPQRIQRALEVYEISGEPLSAFHARGREGELPWCVKKLALEVGDRSFLHERIETRFMQMLESGLVAEVSKLMERKKFDASLPAMRAVGYRQVIKHLEGRLSYGEMVEQAIVATRQYAKRQMTWLRGEAELVNFPAERVNKGPELFESIRAMLRAWLRETK
jgi:tRNA dimethylallyltransferase